MIGIDITLIKRFENKSENFARKILSENEFKIWINEKFQAKFLATRWAIKEAIFKSDNNFSCFSNINLKKKEGKYCFKNFQLSTSTEGDYVIAIALKKEVC